MRPVVSAWHSVSSPGLGVGEGCDSAGPYITQDRVGGVPIGGGVGWGGTECPIKNYLAHTS